MKYFKLLKKPSITVTIILNRLGSFGHVQKMEENRNRKGITYEFGNNKIDR